MNEQDKLKANMIGAKLLGGNPEVREYRDSEHMPFSVIVFDKYSEDSHPKEIDIFTNKEDRMDVVEALGDKHCVYLVPEFNHIGDDIVATGRWEADGKGSFYTDAHETYREAVAAALLELYPNV